jgi:hypothetical protein
MSATYAAGFPFFYYHKDRAFDNGVLFPAIILNISNINISCKFFCFIFKTNFDIFLKKLN